MKGTMISAEEVEKLEALGDRMAQCAIQLQEGTRTHFETFFEIWLDINRTWRDTTTPYTETGFDMVGFHACCNIYAARSFRKRMDHWYQAIHGELEQPADNRRIAACQRAAHEEEIAGKQDVQTEKESK